MGKLPEWVNELKTVITPESWISLPLNMKRKFHYLPDKEFINRSLGEIAFKLSQERPDNLYEILDLVEYFEPDSAATKDLRDLLNLEHLSGVLYYLRPSIHVLASDILVHLGIREEIKLHLSHWDKAVCRIAWYKKGQTPTLCPNERLIFFLRKNYTVIGRRPELLGIDLGWQFSSSLEFHHKYDMALSTKAMVGGKIHFAITRVLGTSADNSRDEYKALLKDANSKEIVEDILQICSRVKKYREVGEIDADRQLDIRSD